MRHKFLFSTGERHLPCTSQLVSTDVASGPLLDLYQLWVGEPPSKLKPGLSYQSL